MHCFDGHHVTTLGELTNKDGCPQEIQQLNGISHLMQDGRSKASDLKSNLKNVEAASANLTQHFSKSRSDINDTFQYYVSLLEERKHDVIRELEGQYSRKQMALSLYNQKAHETIDKIYQVGTFSILRNSAPKIVGMNIILNLIADLLLYLTTFTGNWFHRTSNEAFEELRSTPV